MGQITVFHINNRWFLPVSDGVREIPFAIVDTWKREGMEVKVLEGELYD